jgi:Fur family ferric uptake transcriptional regulator
LIELRNRIAVEKGFRVTNHRLIIQGICEDCSKIRRTRRKQDLV